MEREADHSPSYSALVKHESRLGQQKATLCMTSQILAQTSPRRVKQTTRRLMHSEAPMLGTSWRFLLVCQISVQI
jgi:hypothetical protein